MNIIEFNGRRQSMSAWARELGMSRQMLHKRLTGGWSVSSALTAPKAKSKFAPKLIEFNGKRQSITAWARETGIPKSTLSLRLKKGWPTEELFKGGQNV
jgi:hypothetical protein